MSARIGRFRDAQGSVWSGVVDGERVQPVVGDPWGGLEPVGASLPLAQVQVLAPVSPSKVVGVGSNYRAHAVEMGRALPSVPKLFLKPSTAVIGPGQAIPLPPSSQLVHHEAELGVVIGRPMSRVPAARALEHVLGYTCVNDVTARDHQRADGVFARGKGFDGFCPLGPWVVSGLDPSDLRVRAWVDGQLRQDGRTSDLVFDVPTLLAFISDVMTLLPGDVVATGTPSGVGPLVDGQTVVVEVEGVGRLQNPVRNRAD